MTLRRLFAVLYMSLRFWDPRRSPPARPSVPQPVRSSEQCGDATGAALLNVAITVAGDALMGVRPASTAADGSFRIAALPPGDYTIGFSLPGFSTHQHRVSVALGFTATVDVELAAAAHEERLTVVGPHRRARPSVYRPHRNVRCGAACRPARLAEHVCSLRGREGRGDADGRGRRQRGHGRWLGLVWRVWNARLEPPHDRRDRRERHQLRWTHNRLRIVRTGVGADRVSWRGVGDAGCAHSAGRQVRGKSVPRHALR